MKVQFTQFDEIKPAARRNIRANGGKISRTNEITFPKGTTVHETPGKSLDGIYPLTTVMYILPNNSKIMYHPEQWVYA